MAQETIVLVNELSDRYITAEDSLNNNFGELYASKPPAPTLADAGKVVAVNMAGTAYELITVSGSGLTFTQVFAISSLRL